MDTNPKNRRKILFIKKQFQTNFIIKFCLIVLFTSLLFGSLLFFFTRNSTTVVFKNLRIQTIPTQEFLLPSLTAGLFISLAVASILTIVLMIGASHKIGGPMYRFEITLNRLAEGDLRQFVVLRDFDQLKDIADSLTNALESLRKKMSNINNQVTRLELDLKESGIAPAQLSEVRKAIAEFKY
jgi:methyl-accepting chemotaxis protein